MPSCRPSRNSLPTLTATASRTCTAPTTPNPSYHITEVHGPKRLRQKALHVQVQLLMLQQAASPFVQSLFRCYSEPSVAHWYGTEARGSDNLRGPMSLATFVGELSSRVHAGFEVWALMTYTEDESQQQLLASTQNLSPLELCAWLDCREPLQTESVLALHPDGRLDFVLSKVASTEARAFLPFQALAHSRFAESRSSYFAQHRISLRLTIRKGNLPALRMLQKAFRLHLAEAATVPLVEEGACDMILVRLEPSLAVRLMHGFEGKRSPPKRSQLPWILHAQQHGEAAPQIPTSIDAYIEQAKPIWNEENALVDRLQPHRRSSASKVVPPDSVVKSASNSSLDGSSTGLSDISPSHSRTASTDDCRNQRPSTYSVEAGTPLLMWHAESGQYIPAVWVGPQLEGIQAQLQPTPQQPLEHHTLFRCECAVSCLRDMHGVPLLTGPVVYLAINTDAL